MGVHFRFSDLRSPSPNPTDLGRAREGAFYCNKAGLVIEVDGDVHDLQQKEDERREKVLNELGVRIVRFRNDEVVKNCPTVLLGNPRWWGESKS